jgi:acetoacetyl-CoA reductase
LWLHRPEQWSLIVSDAPFDTPLAAAGGVSFKLLDSCGRARQPGHPNLLRDFHAYSVDVADYDSCQRGALKIRNEVGTIDILVNNAGITRDMTFRKMDKVNWDAVLRTNLDSIFNISKPLCDGMVEQAWGRIINISSVNGSKGSVDQTNYAAAKAGMRGFTKSLALEVARKRATVNTISPGYLFSAGLTATSVSHECRPCVSGFSTPP